jgi:cobalt-zinc-cadmium efflux system protein
MALLHDHPKGDVNVRSAFLHMAQDSVASLAVVLAALLAHTAAGPYADPVVALLVGLVVLRSSFSLAWETLSTILEGVPSDVDVVELANQVDLAFPPVQLHHVHVWEIGPDQRLLTAHVTLGQDMSGCQIEELLGRIKSFLHERWKINHSTLEPEIGVCAHPGLLGCWDTEPHEEHR